MSSTVKKFSFNPFQENTFVVHDENVCVIIDPGCSNGVEERQLDEYISSHQLKVEAILLTHSHLDHIFGLDYVSRKYASPVYMHKLDIPTFNMAPKSAHLYGIPGFVTPEMPSNIIGEEQQLSFGSLVFDVKFTPGHAPGHVVYFNEQDGYVINGDVLFAGAFGRVDLPGGDMDTLKRTIFDVMFKLPEDTVVYSGHGTETTIGKEKRTNYILEF